ncbi:TetR/AcrR family transcriptional regulator [Aureibacter tunicatorum]|uniref:AcrR family transcriptional regulator n=1 Tax=Aureibacter tunicatorum TaxID=866807 RepID=A0AAE3XQA4_9BACT|nr:TetR/AcrR family transcriptional regulator [Aureibacter tunicatorum]MDR6241157.1 AcrR family transcriptional regulator [Aureibacter tunicatorum]BDD03934.1 putative HTH-type transcriptional regulator [Aureibacter tunicatorum]
MRVKDEEKKKAIYRSTLEIVSNQGIAGIKMADIARKVELSPSTLYIYFKNKEELITSLFTDIMEEQNKTTRKYITENQSFKIKLKNIWVYWLKYSINNYNEISFLQQVKKSPYFDKLPKHILEAKQDIGHDIYKEGKEQLIVKDIDNQVLSEISTAILHKCSALVMDKKFSLSNKDIDTMFSFVWDAIKS